MPEMRGETTRLLGSVEIIGDISTGIGFGRRRTMRVGDKGRTQTTTYHRAHIDTVTGMDVVSKAGIQSFSSYHLVR